MSKLLCSLCSVVGVPLVTANAQAEIAKEKLCIFAAAQKLPNIPGLTIVAVRTSALPENLKGTAGAEAGLIVKIDVKAIATEATFDFVCASPAGKPAVAMPLGMSK